MKPLDHSIFSFRTVCQDLLSLQTQLRMCGICRHYFLQRLLSHQRRADSGHRLTRLNDEIVPKAPKTFDLINDSLLVFGNSISEDIAVVAVKVELVNLVHRTRTGRTSSRLWRPRRYCATSLSAASVATARD